MAPRGGADVRGVRKLVEAVAHDQSALEDLRSDPATLAHSLNLSAGHLAALRSAERFFDTEAPIPDRSGGTPTSASPKRRETAVFTPDPGIASPLVASADTGTLLTGPLTGTFTIFSSATAAADTVAAPVPAPQPSGTPAGGVPSAPATPGGPVTPGGPTTPGGTTTPTAPVFPAGPVTPAGPASPSAPAAGPTPALGAAPCPSPAWPFPGAPVAPTQAAPAGQSYPEPPVCEVPAPAPPARSHVCCQVAVAAMVADVGATADAAMAALTALVHQRHAKASPRRMTP